MYDLCPVEGGCTRAIGRHGAAMDMALLGMFISFAERVQVYRRT